MKKKIGIISVLLVVVIVIILAVLLTNKDDTKSINLDNSIAYYYETDSGGYEQGISNEWSNGNYVLDIEDSSCNNEYGPVDLIDWDPSSNGVLLKANENISCTLYFNKMTAQEKFFESLLGPSGKGELLYHNSQLENGANDHGYRYSGDNPNNFICFGPGSEDYNNGQSEKCEDGNLYRMIGYVPVELSTGKIEHRIKVIKSEYATHDDLEKDEADETEYFNEDYKSLKRVKAEISVDGFFWDAEDDNNIWGNSSLYQALNSNEESFLKNLNSWANKIEQVQWNVEGYNTSQVTAREMYNIENDDTQRASSQVSAKIGLMYPSDYGFASIQDNWLTTLYKYDNNLNCRNNWLYNTIYEWTISRDSGSEYSTFYIVDSGNLDSASDVDWGYGVRPVFYLNSSVTLSGGDGAETKPYKVS